MTTGSPPDFGKLRMGPALVAKRMVPSLLQAPPRALETFASVCTNPVSVLMASSLSSAKNPTLWLSGDQKGYIAPSVFAKGRAVSESRERNHNPEPLSETATKTIFLPLGEMARETRSVVGGVAISRRTSGGWSADLDRTRIVPATIARTAAEAIPIGSHVRKRAFRGAWVFRLSVPASLPDRISSISILASAMYCNRC